MEWDRLFLGVLVFRDGHSPSQRPARRRPRLDKRSQTRPTLPGRRNIQKFGRSIDSGPELDQFGSARFKACPRSREGSLGVLVGLEVALNRPTEDDVQTGKAVLGFSDPHNVRSWFSRDVRRLVLFRAGAGATVRARAVSRKQQGCIAPGPDAGFSAIATTVGGPCHGEFLRREPAPIRRRRWNCILQRPGFRGALARGAPRSASNPRSISKFVSFFSLSLAGWQASGWSFFWVCPCRGHPASGGT